MGKDRHRSPETEKQSRNGAPADKRKRTLEEDEPEPHHESDDGIKRSSSSSRSSKKKIRSSKRRSKRDYSDDDDDYSSRSSSDDEDSDSYSDSESGSSDYSSERSENEEERRRRKRRERKKREEREKEKKRRRREKEKRKKKDEEKSKKKRKDKKKKKKDKDVAKKGAVTDLWGKYGIIREIDMWNKRPEFTAWLAEVKQVNLESLPNWEEKQMFKQFMEDHNTATFPSKKYYSLDAYHRRKLEKEIKRGSKKAVVDERTIFDDEEQRRLEMLQVREKQKEAEVETLKRSMQSGLAQAMKEQAQLKEEMAYQYRLGNFEAAAAIQRRLDPDIPM